MTNRPPLPQGFDDLPVEDQIDYVQGLWDRIAAKADQVPVPDWHRQVLEERLSGEPGTGKPWEEVREEIRAKLHRKTDSG